MKRKKITIVGAGNVGATAALWTLMKDLGDVVLIDIVDAVKGKALDLMQAAPLLGVDSKITGTTDYKDTKDSDVVVITAGMPRKEGMTREDLININAKIVHSVTEQAVKHSPNAILIVVSNPLDAMAYVAYKVSKFPRERVIGMAGVLDSTRFRTLIADELKVSVKDVNAMVLGSHGDTMIPMERIAEVYGVSVKQLIPEDRLNEIISRTRNGGAEFLPLLKTSAWVAPGLAAAEMVESIIKDKKRVQPCCIYLNGEYGVKDVFIGVPVKLGSRGAEEIIELEFTESEQEQFNKTVEHVTKIIGVVKSQYG